MKKLGCLISTFLLISFANSCKSVGNQSSDVASGTTIANGIPPFPVDISIEKPSAGIDYPTDRPADVWDHSSVLVIENERVRVPGGATFAQPKAGVDYPRNTGLPIPFRGRKVLVLDQFHRLPLLFVRDAREGTQLSLRNGKVIAINKIKAIEPEQSGIDPADISRDDHYVVVLLSGERIAIPPMGTN